MAERQDDDLPKFEDLDLLGLPTDEVPPNADAADEPLVPGEDEDVLKLSDEAKDGTSAPTEDTAEEPAEDKTGPETTSDAEEEAKDEAEKAEEEKEQRASFWEKLAQVGEKLGQASPYTVILGAALAAVLIAALCMYFELSAYNLDIRAEEPKQQMGV